MPFVLHLSHEQPKLTAFEQEVIRLLTENNYISKVNQKLLLSIDDSARKIKVNTNSI